MKTEYIKGDLCLIAEDPKDEEFLAGLATDKGAFMISAYATGDDRVYIHPSANPFVRRQLGFDNTGRRPKY